MTDTETPELTTDPSNLKAASFFMFKCAEEVLKRVCLVTPL